MEDDDFRLNFVPPESDRGSESSAGLESRSESNSFESGVTVQSPRCCSCDSCGDADTRPDECSGWTNEKHNSYLDYLEKSFVRQLYRRSFRTHDQPSNPCKSGDQNGCWKKINFGNKRTLSDASSDIHSRENTLKSHFAEPSGSYKGATNARGDLLCNEETDHSSDKAFSRTSSRNPIGCERSTESSAEASGQNFTDEDREKEPSHSPVCKRRKRDQEHDCSVNHQVVAAKQKGVSGVGKYEQIDA